MKRFVEHVPYEYVVVIKSFAREDFIGYPFFSKKEKQFYTYEEALNWFYKTAEEEDDNYKVYRIELRKIKDDELIRWVE